MNALVTTTQTNAEVYRASTDAAGLCREIVLKTAQNIQGRKYVKVEGWQAIAVAHGCAASADHVERVNDEGMSGFKAIGVVRRMSDGAEIARAEGFLGDDEKMWANRPVYARRAMVQTRAISRACRSAFAHVVVLIDANLSTTPAEEVPMEGFGDADSEPRNITPRKGASNPAGKDYGPSSPGADFPGAEGVKGKSSYAAKKDGTDVRFQEMRNELWGCESLASVAAWANAHADEIKSFPEGWRKQLREDLDEQRRVIRAQMEADGEVIDDFPGDMPSGVAGADRDMAGAH